MRTLWRFIAGFFKWTWRLLNFVREMVLNLFFIFLVLVGVGIWMQVSGGDSKETASRGALLLDISGVIVDKLVSLLEKNGTATIARVKYTAIDIVYHYFQELLRTE